MKKNILTFMLLISFGLYAVQAFSQFNPLTNSFSKVACDVTVPIQADDLITYSSASGVPCIANSFWAIASTGVDQFTLEGDVITKVGTTVITGLFDANLAFCNNLNGGAFSPTFYSTKNFNQPVYYDGSGVTNTSNIYTDKLINCGGNGNYLYYISYDTSFKAKAIVRYDGSAF